MARRFFSWHPTTHDAGAQSFSFSFGPAVLVATLAVWSSAASAATVAPSLAPSGVPSLEPTSIPTGTCTNDRSALSALYLSTGGKTSGQTSGWFTRTNWMDDSKDISEWYGITCGGGSVRSVELENNGLKGPLPSEVGLLTNSGEISLSLPSNSISSTLPTQLGALSGMKAFNLQNNGLSSSLPTEMGLLASSKVALLKSNGISSSLPTQIGLLTNVEVLFLGTNMISSSLPSEILLLTRMLAFDMNVNSLSSSLPSELAVLSSLLELGLSSNAISSSLPTQLGLLASANHINLDTNSLSSTLPSELFKLSSMKAFGLLSNAISSSLPSQIGFLTSVEHFALNNNEMSSSLPTELGQLTGVTWVFLQSNGGISSTLPTQLGLLSKMEKCHLNNNNISSLLPTQLGELSSMKVFLFSDQDSQATGALPTQIGRLTSLENFVASSTSIAGTIPSEIGSIGGSLELFSLTGNQLESTLPHSMCNLSSLVIASLSANSLTGELPKCSVEFHQLKVFNVAKNRLTGPLPSVRRWPGINYLLLHDNKLTGNIGALEFNRSQHRNVRIQANDDRIDESIDEYGQNVIALTLHNNYLTGTIPRYFTLPRSLETFTMANNELTGRLPRSMLELQRGKSNASLTLFATNNRLSCDLPRSWNFTTSSQSLVLIGNAFTEPVPLWVSELERKSSFLSVPVRVAREKGGMALSRLPLWLMLLLQACGVTLLSVPLVVHYYSGVAAFTEHRSPTSRALLKCTSSTAALAAAGLLCLALFGAGANYYECGDGFMKFATAAYMADNYVVEWLFACMCTIWTAGLGFVLQHFAPPPAQRQQAAASAPTSSSPNEDLPVRRSRSSCFVGYSCILLCLGLWFVTLVVLGGAPTFLYVLTYSLPARNIMEFSSLEVSAFRHALALYLSFVSAELIPVLTKPTARAILEYGLIVRGFDSNVGKAEHHEVETVLGIIARTLVLVVLPVAAVFLLDNGCQAMWTYSWTPCRSSGYFFEKVAIDVTVSFVYSVHGTTIDYAVPISPVKETTVLELINNDAVCSPSYQNGRCSRGMLEILCPLFISKLLYAILFSALQPILGSRFDLAGGWLKKNCWWPLLTCLRCKQRNAEAQAGKKVETKGNLVEPDPMKVLIWYETAFIFGCLSPLLVVVLAAQLFTAVVTFEWMLSRAPSANGEGQPLPILQGALQWHLHLVLAFQAAMIIFFFVDNSLAGRQLVMVTLPLVVVTVTLSALSGKRAVHLQSKRLSEGDTHRQQQRPGDAMMDPTRRTMPDYFDFMSMLSRQTDDAGLSRGRITGDIHGLELSGEVSPNRKEFDNAEWGDFGQDGHAVSPNPLVQRSSSSQPPGGAAEE